MVDLAAVSATVTWAMAVAGPYLAMLKGAGGKVLDGVETKLGEKAVEVLTQRLTGAPAEALQRAKAAPDEVNLAMLEAAVKVVAAKNEGLLRELGLLMKESGRERRVSSVVTGDDNTVTQIVGDGNTTR